MTKLTKRTRLGQTIYRCVFAMAGLLALYAIVRLGQSYILSLRDIPPATETLVDLEDGLHAGLLAVATWLAGWILYSVLADR
jgi:hypothetical protein